MVYERYILGNHSLSITNSTLLVLYISTAVLFLLIHTTFCLLIFVVSLRRCAILLFMLFCSYGLRSHAILLFMLLGIVMVLEMKLCYFVYDIL